MWLRFTASIVSVVVILRLYSRLDYPAQSTGTAMHGVLQTYLQFLDGLRGYSMTSGGDIIYCVVKDDPFPDDSAYHRIQARIHGLHVTLDRCCLGVSILLIIIILSQFVTRQNIKRACLAMDPLKRVARLAPFRKPSIVRKSSLSAPELRQDGQQPQEDDVTETASRMNAKEQYGSGSSDTCLDKATGVEEISKRIEYLTRINTQRERQINKLYKKTDLLAQSLTRAHRNSKRLSTQSRDHIEILKKRSLMAKPSHSDH